MKWQNILLRLRALFCRREMDEELSEELQFHLEMQARKNQGRNLDVAEARRRARLQFGSFERAKEACREARGVHLLETLLQDLRYGTRTLLKAPGFTVVAVVTLALGIGTNSAIFSAVHSVLLKDLPVREPEKLKLLDWSYAPGWRFPEKFQLHSNGHLGNRQRWSPSFRIFPPAVPKGVSLNQTLFYSVWVQSAFDSERQWRDNRRPTRSRRVLQRSRYPARARQVDRPTG